MLKPTKLMTAVTCCLASALFSVPSAQAQSSGIVASARPVIASTVAPAAATPQLRKASALSAVHYRLLKPLGIPCHVVDVDLTNPHIRLRVARARDYGTNYRTFGSLVRRSRPLAAITGTFFDTGTGTIIGNLVRDGQLIAEGSVGHTLSLDENNRTSWRPGCGPQDWASSEFAVSSGPTLVRDGDIALNPGAEGFHDPGLFRFAARAGVATTRNGHLLMVTTNRHVSMRGFARIMRRLGANNALNLDGGSSTALYARGRYLSRPARRLTNVLLVGVRPGDPVPEEVELEARQAQENAPVTLPDDELTDGAPPEPDAVNLDQASEF